MLSPLYSIMLHFNTNGRKSKRKTSSLSYLLQIDWIFPAFEMRSMVLFLEKALEGILKVLEYALQRSGIDFFQPYEFSLFLGQGTGAAGIGQRFPCFLIHLFHLPRK